MLGALAVLGLLSACSSDSSSAEGDERNPVIADALSCSDCRIEFHELAVLGASTDPTSVRTDGMRACMVGQLSTGEYVVSGMVGGGALYFFPDTGGGMARSLGRSGRGPTEFGQSIRVMVGPLDSLHVLDDSNGRLQVLDPAGVVVRTFPLPTGNTPATLLSDGSYVFGLRPTEVGQALFDWVGPAGARRIRLGSARGPDAASDQWIVGPGEAGEFMAASIWDYVVYRWDGPGGPVDTVARAASWFSSRGQPPASELAEIYATLPPPPMFRHFWDDPQSDTLWTYLQVPDPDWRPGLPVRMSPEWGRATFDTVVEAIDLSTGEVVARGRFDEQIGPMCQGPLTYVVRETEEGDTRMVVQRAIVVRRPS